MGAFELIVTAASLIVAAASIAFALYGLFARDARTPGEGWRIR